MENWIIKTENLTKQYDNLKGCRDVNIRVGEGEVFGLLGPNGAGKSTLIKMLVGLLFPTSGFAQILGQPLGHLESRKRIGYLPELFKYQEWMTGKDLLVFHSKLYKLESHKVASKVDEVLEMVNMKGSEQYRIGTYSKGMQQRIGLASAMLCDPLLIFLDEPTSALDPIGRKEVRDIIVKLRDGGKTVFLNSHLLSEVEMVCDSAAIISHGHIIKQGKMNELLEGQRYLEIEADGLGFELLRYLEDYDPNLSFEGRKLKLKLAFEEDTPAIAQKIIEGGGKLYSLKAQSNRLEDLFIQLIEKGEE